MCGQQKERGQKFSTRMSFAADWRIVQDNWRKTHHVHYDNGHAHDWKLKLGDTLLLHSQFMQASRYFHCKDPCNRKRFSYQISDMNPR